jgi:hypothetical protein
MQRILHLLVITLLPLSLFAQAPQKMSYQAVIRNSSGALVTSKAVGMRVSILQGTANGTEVYKEIYNPNPQTNANGLVSIEIGGGVPVTGTFAGINWANGPYFIKTETDPNGGTNYTINGTSQLLSVPYALYAGNVVNGGGKPIILIANDITNAQAQAQIAAEVGPNTVEIRIENCSNLTSIDLSAITKIIDISISRNPQLLAVNLSNLQSCSSIDIGECPKLNSLNLSSLTTISGLNAFEITNTNLTNLTFNSLLTLSGLFISGNDLLGSISFPVLKKTYGIGSFEISNNKTLTSISLPLLESVNSIYIGYNDIIGSLSFPGLKEIGEYGVQIIYNQNLSSVSIPSLSIFNGTGASFSNNKLPSSEINNLLGKFVSITPALTGKGFGFSGQNPPAPPTGQGITDKATLIARGNSVVTD